MGYEPALAPYFAPHERGLVEEQWSEAEVAEAEVQLDGLADMLQGLGVVVQRPGAIRNAAASVVCPYTNRARAERAALA